jgi:hypothetical protein
MKAVFDIIAAIFWIVVRGLKIRDNPQNQYQKAKSENARIIRDADAPALNGKLDVLTDRLPVGRGDSQGS